MPTAARSTGFARIVVATAGRRLELAVPEHHTVGALLPELARRAGLDAPGTTDPDRAWALCRADGVLLDPAVPLAPQEVRDGEVLHLVPADVHWPQPHYETVTRLAGKPPSPPWRPASSRAALLALAAAPLVAVPRLVGSTAWRPVAVVLLTGAAVLLMAGLALFRWPGRARAGAELVATALPASLLGGAAVVGSGMTDRPALGSPHVLVAAVAVGLVGVLGLVSLTELTWLWLAALVTGFAGAAGGLLAMGGLTGAEAAAVLVTLLLIAGPAYPLLSVRLAGVPVPPVPRTTEELVRGYPVPALPEVAGRVERSGELLTGLLVGSGTAVVVAVAVLAVHPGLSAELLTSCVAGSFLLRARLFVTAAHRAICLVTGAIAATVTVLGLGLTLAPAARIGVLLPALLAGAGVAGAAGLVYSRRSVSPYLGRLADVLDVLLTLALALLAASVMGLYHLMRGLGG
jgi:type VII secretion integral membrane protein EccD